MFAEGSGFKYFCQVNKNGVLWFKMTKSNDPGDILSIFQNPKGN